MLTVFEVVNQNLSLKTNYIERIRGSQWVHQQIFYHYHRKALQPVNVKCKFKNNIGNGKDAELPKLLIGP